MYHYRRAFNNSAAIERYQEVKTNKESFESSCKVGIITTYFHARRTDEAIAALTDSPGEYTITSTILEQESRNLSKVTSRPTTTQVIIQIARCYHVSDHPNSFAKAR